MSLLHFLELGGAQAGMSFRVPHVKSREKVKDVGFNFINFFL